MLDCFNNTVLGIHTFSKFEVSELTFTESKNGIHYYGQPFIVKILSQKQQFL